MADCPRKLPRIVITYVIAIGLLLRSLVAPGFMLDTSDGLAIVFCEGPAGAYIAASRADDPHAHHDHQDHGSHFTTSCTDWSSSGLLVINTFFDNFRLPVADVTRADYQSPILQHVGRRANPSRGPPLLTT